MMNRSDGDLPQIVSDASLATLAQRIIPQTLVVCLAEAAARAQRCKSLAQLMEVWPQPSLKLSKLKLARNIDHAIITEKGEDKKAVILEEKEMVLTLLDRLLKIARAGKLPVNLETLDVTGFPLVFSRLMDILRGFAETQSNVLGEKRSSIRLRVDLYLTDKECWQLNRERQLPVCGVQVSVRHVYFTIVSHTSSFAWQTEYLACLTKLKRVWHHIFDFTSTTGLELARLDIRSFFAESATTEERNAGTSFLSDLANTFDQINTLDISYNAINLNGSPSTCAIMGEFLSHLGGEPKGLLRLDLSGNRLTNHLSALLKHTPNLHYLNLTGTQLRTIDISFLSQMRSLRHLDLSCCSLHNKLNALLGIFGSLTEMKVLEMVDCSLEQSHLDELMPGLLRLEKLELLNISFNAINPVENVDRLKCRVVMDQYEEVRIELHGGNEADFAFEEQP